MSVSEVAGWSLCETARALVDGRLGLAEYLTDLRAHERVHGDFGAYITSTGEPALEKALRQVARPPGPLHGIPLAVKDNIDVAGIRTTAATPRLGEHVPGTDSGVWRRLAEAGAVLAGKTSMHELAYGITGACVGAPTARNPVAPGHFAGGSSAGTAAAVAAGLVPAGLGTDTGGSARIPAAFCGIYGFRPTTRRYPHEGVVRISPSRDTVGVMARALEDIVLLDRILAGEIASGPQHPGGGLSVRLAIPEGAWADLDAEVARVAGNALRALRDGGCTLVATRDDIAGGPGDDLLEVAFTVPLAETPEAVGGYLASHGCDYGFGEVVREIASPDVLEILLPLLDAPVPERELHAALETQERLRVEAVSARRQSRIDAVVMPTTILPAPPVTVGAQVMVGGRQVPTFAAYVRNTAPAAVLGVPSLTMPIGTDANGLPVGLQFDGHAGGDARLLGLGQRLAALLDEGQQAGGLLDAVLQ